MSVGIINNNGICITITACIRYISRYGFKSSFSAFGCFLPFWNIKFKILSSSAPFTFPFYFSGIFIDFRNYNIFIPTWKNFRVSIFSFRWREISFFGSFGFARSFSSFSASTSRTTTSFICDFRFIFGATTYESD